MTSSDATSIGARLEIHCLNCPIEHMPLGQNPIVIGRDPSCDIPTPAELKTISRRHAEVFLQAGEYYIRDLGSQNGVVINDQRIHQPTRLAHGDVIFLGLDDGQSEVRLRFLHPLQPPLPEPDAAAPSHTPHLELRQPDGTVKTFPLAGDRITAGRSEDVEIPVLPHWVFVAERHFEIRLQEGVYAVVDLGSPAGTRLNNRLLPPGEPRPLHDGDILRVSDDRAGISLGWIYHNPLEQKATGLGWQPLDASLSLERQKELTIGRAPENDLVLTSMSTSRQHAVIRSDGGRHTLTDLGSRNGTLVNGERVEKVELFDGDLIEIGEHLLLFQRGEITPYTSTGFRLDVVDLKKRISDRRGERQILKGIDMTVLPKEFLAVVGASGAGKTTFMRALNGTSPGEGQVLINGRDLYREFDRFRTQLGYVPQFDILHTTLTVDQALDYAAKLRLPADTSPGERRARVDQALATVSMDAPEVRSTRIANLSGGQRKRVSIAAELLANPRLIFLDEATSGLDPGLEKQMMYTFRRMADEGRTIVLITHATANIVQADHVAFLAEGRLVYIGPSRDALDFFEVQEFADIYDRIETDADRWERVFKEEKPAYYQTYVEERRQSRRALPTSVLQPARVSLMDWVRQFGILTHRAFKVITSDWLTLTLLMLLFPLTALLQLVIATPHVLTGDPAFLADPAAAAVNLAKAYVPFPDMNTFVFVMGLEAVLVGLFVPSTELIKERSIYRRERMINLRILPYLSSKVVVFTLFSFIQVLLYMLVLSIGVQYPEQGVFLPASLELFITLFLTMLAGNGLGLLISALSRNNEIAIYLLTLMLFFQFFFAGTVFDLRGHHAETLSYFTTTRWSLTALGSTLDMKGITESTVLCSTLDNPFTPGEDETTTCFHYPEAVEDLMLPYGEKELIGSWIVLLGTMFLGLSATAFVVKRLDTI